MSNYLSTPTVVATDPRGLPVRSVRYYRRSWTETAMERAERTVYHADGRVASQYDARSIGRGEPIGRAAMAFGTPWTWSADDGEAWVLPADTGQLLWSQDARGFAQAIVYDAAGRPASRHETVDGASRCVGRYEYGYGGGQMADANLSGRAVVVYDEAGKRELKRVSLTGQVQESSLRLLKDDADPDWLEGEENDEALASEVAVSSATYDARGAWLTQVDASGNMQSVVRAVDGLPTCTNLTPAGQATRALATALHYGPSGELILQETANGVARRWVYDDRNGRLLSTTTRRGGSLMQDLRYSYDRVGNILAMDDAALPIVFFRGSRVSATRTFTYDAFYQLIEATGREHASAQHGPCLPDLVILPGGGGNAIRAYMRTYHYDEGGNLFKMQHQVPSDTAASFTTTMVVAPLSNRALPSHDGLNPGDIDSHFDACGNPHHLQPAGQALRWNGRRCLHEIVSVARAGVGDSEHYLYDENAQRTRKRWQRQVAGVLRCSETLYLGPLERRFNEVTHERLEVTTSALGQGNVRYLHWTGGERPDAIRYDIDDHQGSSGMELDENGDLVAYEEYYPYGGTALQAARSEIEVDYRTVRYSGKERDATGLYYYGYRYYAPWLRRWLSPDPARDVDGLNLYRMLQNNPINLVDPDGLAPSGWFVYGGDGQERELEVDEMVNIFNNGQPKIIISGDGHSFPPFGFAKDIPDVMASYKSKKLNLYVEDTKRNARGNRGKFLPAFFNGVFNRLPSSSLKGWEPEKFHKNMVELNNMAMEEVNRGSFDAPSDEFIDKMQINYINPIVEQLAEENMDDMVKKILGISKGIMESKINNNGDTLKYLLDVANFVGVTYRDEYINDYLAKKIARSALKRKGETILVSVGDAHLYESNNSMSRNLARQRSVTGFPHEIIFNREKSPVVPKGGSR